jgi:hypothetical protein
MPLEHRYYSINYVFEFQCLSWTVGSLILPRVLTYLCLRAATASAMNMPLTVLSGFCARSSFSGCDRIHEMSLGSPISDLFIDMSLVSFSASQNWYPPEIFCRAKNFLQIMGQSLHADQALGLWSWKTDQHHCGWLCCKY